jgi:hypothetical protein
MPGSRHVLLGSMAGTTGLEPATSAVTGQRSNQLNYVPAGNNCWWAVSDSNGRPPGCKPVQATRSQCSSIDKRLSILPFDKIGERPWSVLRGVEALQFSLQCFDCQGRALARTAQAARKRPKHGPRDGWAARKHGHHPDRSLLVLFQHGGRLHFLMGAKRKYIETPLQASAPPT